MSRLVKPDEVEDLEFKWGKKRGVGGKKKEVQFYESFTYDGVDYTLHDSVYMHKEGEPDPYIGKIVKIWGNPDKSKKVKIQWFFRPLEISEWIRDSEVLENEIFFASGEGVGLANVNPLEAIAGKCNVVCISKDHRNPQPSVEELQMADYVFYRTFDVGNCTISNVLEDKVGGLESKFLFNRRENENPSSVSKVEFEGKEDNRNAVVCNETVQNSQQNKRDELGGNCNQPVVREDAKAEDLLVKQETSTGERPASGAIVYSSEVPMTSVENRSVSGGKTTRHQFDSSKDKVYDVKVEERIKSVKASDDLDDRPSKKARVDIGIKLSDANNMKSVRKSVVLGNDDVKGVVEKKVKIGHGKDFYKLDQGVKTAQDSVALNDRPAKKTGVGSSVKLSEDKNKKSVEKLIINYDPNEPKDLVKVAASSDGKLKSRLAKDSLGLVKCPPKKEKPDEKSSKLSNGKLPKVFADEDRITVGQILEVTRKPDADKSKWFRTLPWEERMKNAHEKGALALLQNLDPKYTSEEVEDIIWHAFNENCSAKMVPCIAISSPHSGQAFVIFRTRETTERVIKKLDDGCLMLSNGRPLIGCFGPPSLSGKQPTFFGHLFVDKFKLQMQREMKEAVSTSHCSQPNTIEYEMAMEWCLLQSRSDSWWKSLHKQQGQDLRKLMANLKSK